MKCNLCESLETTFILSGSDSYMKVDKKKFDIYQCKNCKVTSLQPMPTQEELKKVLSFKLQGIYPRYGVLIIPKVKI